MLDAVDNQYKLIKVKKFAPNLGAEISGIDLSKEINAEQFDEILKAFHQHQVLFFKEQKEISPQIQVKFGKMFGELHTHPAAPTMSGHPEVFEIHATKDSKIANGEFWHSDVLATRHHPLAPCYKFISYHLAAVIPCLATCTQPMKVYQRQPRIFLKD